MGSRPHCGRRLLRGWAQPGRCSGNLLRPPCCNLEADVVNFSDPDGLLELSAEQKEAGVIWRQPSAVIANAKIFSSDLRPEDVAQRVVADCSLCASIIVSLLHSRSHNSSVRPSPLSRSPRSHRSHPISRLPCPRSIPAVSTETHAYPRQADMSSRFSLMAHTDE